MWTVFVGDLYAADDVPGAGEDLSEAGEGDQGEVGGINVFNSFVGRRYMDDVRGSL